MQYMVPAFHDRTLLGFRESWCTSPVWMCHLAPRLLFSEAFISVWIWKSIRFKHTWPGQKHKWVILVCKKYFYTPTCPKTPGYRTFHAISQDCRALPTVKLQQNTQPEPGGDQRTELNPPNMTTPKHSIFNAYGWSQYRKQKNTFFKFGTWKFVFFAVLGHHNW